MNETPQKPSTPSFTKEDEWTCEECCSLDCSCSCHKPKRGWQPIDSAPQQDRALIIAFCPDAQKNEQVIMAEWDAHFKQWDIYIDGQTVYHPITHWMPLPEPPESA